MVKKYRYSVKNEVTIRGLKFTPGQPLISELRLPFSPEEEAQLNIEENENGFDPSQIELEGLEDAKIDTPISEQVKVEEAVVDEPVVTEEVVVETEETPVDSDETPAVEPVKKTASKKKE